MQAVDISAEVYGRYQYCFGHNGVWYSDQDEGIDGPKWGAKPRPGQAETRPFNPIAEIWRSRTRKRSY